ncbi:hypothetical protein [Hyphobacterium sp.]|uniref:hypothetical protein n=1 Tax=Hyphobacterium sp. TaxID=2004662 RepID=UPI003749C210
MLDLITSLFFMNSIASNGSAASCISYDEPHQLYHRSMEVTDYIAAIDPDDLVGSDGVPFSGFRDVLRQDRANVHRGQTTDSIETPDSFFTTPERRGLFESMNVVTWCYEPLEELAGRIESGTVAGFLEVTVFESTVHPGNYFIHIATVG